MTAEPSAAEAAKLAGASVRVTGNKPVVPDGEGVIVVVDGVVDAFFVPVDVDGRPGLPEFVGQLGPGEALVRGWWSDPSLALPAGRGLLRAVGESALVDVPTGVESPEPVEAAVARWRNTVASFAASGRGAQGPGATAPLERRRALDEALAVEGNRGLFRVFAFDALTRRPVGLPPLAATLAEAAAAAGSPPAASRLEELAHEGREDESVQEVAARLRIPIRAVTLDGPWWTEGGQPFVAFRGDEPVALLPRRRGYVVRGAAGRSARVDAGTAGAIRPDAYAVYPRLPDRPVTLRDLLGLAFHGGKGLLAGLAALTAVVAAFGAFLPYATANIVGVIVPSGSSGALGAMLIALGAFTLAYLAATVVQGLAVLALSSRASAGLTGALLDRLLHVPPSFFRGRAAGRLAQEVTMVDQMRMLVGSALVAGLAGSALSVAAIVLLFVYAPAIAVLVVGVFAVTLALAGMFVHRQGRALERVIEDRNRLNGLLLGLLSGVSKLRVAGAERRAHALWQRGYAFQQEDQRNASLESVHQSVLQGLVPGLSLLVIMVAIAAILGDASSLVAFTGSVAAAGQLAAAAGSMIVVATTIVQLRPLYKSALPILETPPEIRVGAPLPEELAGEVRLDNVSFGYTKDAPILDQVTFTAEAGSFVAIVGSSGAGKSTILRIILGFEEPWTGEVLLDGKPIKSLDVEAVRRRMGTVIQNAKIMTGSILTNILGTLPLGQEAAWEAAEMAGVADEIRAMPMQMHTVVSEAGSSFSGGQLQRLLLARALVRQPKILLLDEATSALDNETQKGVMERLGELGVTRIVIAHRLSTIIDADHVVVIEAGKVVEDGPSEELMAKGGRFAELASRQLV